MPGNAIRRPGRRAAVALGVGLTLLLTACDWNGPDPRTLPSATPPPSTTTTSGSIIEDPPSTEPVAQQVMRPGGGMCGDPWVSSAVQAETTIPAVGAVCDVKLYNNGHWDSYSELALAVRSVMTTCSDEWVTQAVIEVTGGMPTGNQCDVSQYGNDQWGSYDELRSDVVNTLGHGEPVVGVSTKNSRHYQLLDVGGTQLRRWDNYGLMPAYPVSTHPDLYVVYWGKDFNGNDAFVQYVNAAVEYMVHSHYMHRLRQYGVQYGVDVGYWVDPSSDPAGGFLGQVLDVGGHAGVQAEINRLRANGQSAIPQHWDPSTGRDPVVIVLESENTVGSGDWGGYHYWMSDATDGGSTTYGWMPYIVVKVPQRALWIDQDAIRDVTDRISHELVETVTNTMPLYGWSDWGQPDAPWASAEPSDICQYYPSDGSANANNHGYPYATMQDAGTGYTYRFARYWSNSDNW